VRIGNFFYFVSAVSGKVLHRYFDSPTLKQRNTYEAGNSLPGTLVLNETGPLANVKPTSAATAAHAYAGFAYDYFFETFQRDSYDNADHPGAVLKSSVNYAQLPNALWDPMLRQMVYGPGFTCCVEITGHEITHGIIYSEAGLKYFGESGAANEAFADFFGVMVASKGQSTATWTIGSNLPGHNAVHPLRDMAHPHNGHFKKDADFAPLANDGQPETRTEMVQPADKICAKTTDAYNGCVHFNSGVLNRAFYLAANGQPGTPGEMEVVGLGASKLAQILYRTLTAKLTSTSDFRAVADGAVEACIDLSKSGKYSISNDDCLSLRRSFVLVGILT